MAHTYKDPNINGVAKNDVLAGGYNFKIKDLEFW